jgi:hypothetical protein
MHLKQKLTFMAFGSILTLAGYLLATPTRDVTAQSETDKATVFDEIYCRELNIVDEDGKTRVTIGTISNGGFMSVDNADGRSVVTISTTSSGGFMLVNHADGGTAVTIGTSDDKRGFVSVDGKSTKGLIQLTANEYGGRMSIFGNTDDKTRVLIGINERGHGTINTWDKNGYRTRP